MKNFRCQAPRASVAAFTILASLHSPVAQSMGLARVDLVCAQADCASRSSGQSASGYSSSVLTSFRAVPQNPHEGLLRATDGNLYGTSWGGDFGRGSVFRIDPAGRITVVHSFDGTKGGTENGLMQASDGYLYGTEVGGGDTDNLGYIFRISPSGQFSVVHRFGLNEGSGIVGRLVEAGDGRLYGVTYGSFGGYGTVFRVSKSGDFQTVHTFGGGNGARPISGLTLGRDGSLYGTTPDDTEDAVAYKIGIDGSFTVLKKFAFDLYVPSGDQLLAAADGAFYGIAKNIDPNGDRRIGLFRLTASGQFEVVAMSSTLLSADASLIQYSNGTIYGAAESATSEIGYGALFRATDAGELKVLHGFSFEADGGSPKSLIQGPGNTFYGTAIEGGPEGARGTVFQIATNGVVKSVIPFSNVQGERPSGPLERGGDGNYYGVTLYGGLEGAGTIYRVTPAGVRSVVYSFGFDTFFAGFDGDVVRQNDGGFYGFSQYNRLIFQIEADGTYSELARFPADTYQIESLVVGRDGLLYIVADGEVYTLDRDGIVSKISELEEQRLFLIRGKLVEPQQGAFFGVTEFGGSNSNSGNGYGAIFRLDADGTATTLHQFNERDGAHPKGALLFASNGNLYGTTAEGGRYGQGTVFRISRSGDFETLHSFSGFDGKNPQTALVEAPRGVIAGVTFGGGALGYGTAFRMPIGGSLTSIHSFGGSDGAIPVGIEAGQQGKLLVTTYAAGPDGGGSIVQIASGSPPVTATPVPTATPTATPTASPSTTPSPTPTAEPTPTAAPTPTASGNTDEGGSGGAMDDGPMLLLLLLWLSRLASPRRHPAAF